MTTLRAAIEKRYWQKRNELDDPTLTNDQRKTLLAETQALTDEFVFLTSLIINAERKAEDDIDKGKAEPDA